MMRTPNTSVNVVTVHVGSAAATLLGPSPRRVAIIISAQGVNFTISMRPQVADKVGLYFVANSTWIQTIDECDVGSAIKQPWYVIGPGGADATIEVTEILADEQQSVGGYEPPTTTPRGDFQIGMQPSEDEQRRQRAGMSSRVNVQPKL